MYTLYLKVNILILMETHLAYSKKSAINAGNLILLFEQRTASLRNNHHSSRLSAASGTHYNLGLCIWRKGYHVNS